MTEYDLHIYGEETRVRIAMGSLSLRQRLRVIWMVLTGAVVVFGGNCLLGLHSKNARAVAVPIAPTDPAR